jgi:hypothetical protein
LAARGHHAQLHPSTRAWCCGGAQSISGIEKNSVVQPVVAGDEQHVDIAAPRDETSERRRAVQVGRSQPVPDDAGERVVQPHYELDHRRHTVLHQRTAKHPDPRHFHRSIRKQQSWTTTVEGASGVDRAIQALGAYVPFRAVWRPARKTFCVTHSVPLGMTERRRDSR